MPDNSFDVVSKVDTQEVANAIQQALKEVHTRFDLKDSKSNIEQEKDAIVLHSADEYKLKAVNDILQQKLVKPGASGRGVLGETGGHSDFGHSHREGERSRQEDQGQQT